MSITKFTELFNEVRQKGILTEDDPTILEIYLNVRFNEWLKKARGWNGEHDTWANLTTQENFASYLKNEALYTDGSLKGSIELYELRFEQNLVLHTQERKGRGQETTIEDEYNCRIRTLKNEQRRNEQFFSNKYPTGKLKGFDPEKRHTFHWDEKKKFEKWVQVELNKFEKLLDGIFNYKELKDSMQDQFDKNYILKLKEAAIQKTIQYFAKFEIHSIESNHLLNHLEKEDDLILIEIENNQNLIMQGRDEDLKKRLIGYLDNNELELNKFEVNHGNRIENSKNNLLEIAQDYCILKFYYLLNSEQLININLNSEKDKKLKAEPPQSIDKQKPVLNKKLITFKDSETIEKIHSELKGYFLNKEAELLKALQGEQLTEILLFPHNQNKFVEVFRRLKYNGFLLNSDTETKNWICTTFHFIKKGFTEPQPFNESSVWDNLNKGKGEPTKKERIFITDWLQYKTPAQLTRETESEKL